MEVKSPPHRSPSRAPGYRGGRAGSGCLATPADGLRIQSDPAVLTSSPWRGGGQPRGVPHGKGREAALFSCPKAVPVPQDRASALQPAWAEGGGIVGPEEG